MYTKYTLLRTKVKYNATYFQKTNSLTSDKDYYITGRANVIFCAVGVH